MGKEKRKVRQTFFLNFYITGKIASHLPQTYLKRHLFFPQTFGKIASLLGPDETALLGDESPRQRTSH